MNSKQRMILILGAAAFLYVIFTSPKISIVKGTYFIPSSDKKNIARMVDIRTAMTRGIAVLGATLLVCSAFKDRQRTRTPSPPGRNPAVVAPSDAETQPVKKEIIAKMIRFLKEFF